jgi:LysR family transcriptional regulator, hydrogen peroxide-inducible genes activator
MNFQQLEYVIAIHEYKHFAKAADACHVTQATLSAMVKKLEEELQLNFFDRSHFPVITTEQGLQFIEQATQILARKKIIEQLKNQNLHHLEGSIKIGVIPTVANSLLPIILPPLLENNPMLKLQILEITTEEITKRLKNGDIDVGILATPLEDELLEENIMYYEPLMIYGVKSNKKFTSSKDIKNQQIWLLEDDHCFRKQSETVCKIKENESINTHLNFAGNSFETLLNLTDKFGGYTLVPELYFHSMPDRLKSLTKPFKKPIPVREISLVTYRPYARKHTASFLSRSISDLVKPLLSTSNMRNSDLEIVGIN